MEPEKDFTTPPPFEAFMVIIASLFLAVLPQLFFVGMSNQGDAEAISPILQKILIITGELGLAVLPFIYLRVRKLAPKTFFRWNPVPAPLLFPSLAVGVSLAVLVDELDRLLNLIIPMPEELSGELAKMMQATGPLDLLLLLLGAVVVAGFVEESIFRGFLQTSLEGHVGATQAVVYSSVAFTAIHFNIYGAIQIFLFGFALGYLAWRTNSIIPAFIVHAANNALAVMYYNVDSEFWDGWYLWGDHVSPLMVAAAVFIGYWGLQHINLAYQSDTSPPSTSI